MIRIICLAVLAVMSAQGRWQPTAAALVLVISTYAAVRCIPNTSFWRLLWRLRWLALPLLILYGWMSPAATGAWPDPEGLFQGSVRIAGLVTLVLAVHLVSRRTTTPQWLAAFYWLAFPMSWMGGSRERFAVRLCLIMDELKVLQSSFGSATPRTMPFWAAAMDKLEEGFRWASQRHTQLLPVFTLETNHPPLLHWIFPIGLCALTVWL